MSRKEAAIQLAEYGLSITEAASVLGWLKSGA